MHAAHAYMRTCLCRLNIPTEDMQCPQSPARSCPHRCTFAYPYLAKLVTSDVWSNWLEWPRPPLRLPSTNQKRPLRKRNLIRDEQTAIGPCFPIVSRFLFPVDDPRVYTYIDVPLARRTLPSIPTASFAPPCRMNLASYSNSPYQQRS